MNSVLRTIHILAIPIMIEGGKIEHIVLPRWMLEGLVVELNRDLRKRDLHALFPAYLQPDGCFESPVVPKCPVMLDEHHPPYIAYESKDGRKHMVTIPEMVKEPFEANPSLFFSMIARLTALGVMTIIGPYCGYVQISLRRCVGNYSVFVRQTIREYRLEPAASEGYICRILFDLENRFEQALIDALRATASTEGQL